MKKQRMELIDIRFEDVQCGDVLCTTNVYMVHHIVQVYKIGKTIFHKHRYIKIIGYDYANKLYRRKLKKEDFDERKFRIVRAIYP